MTYRTPLMGQLWRSVRTALAANRQALSTAEILERRAAAGQTSRRAFLRTAAAASAAAPLAAAPVRTVNVGIVGGGLAGLACADELRRLGVSATVYEGQTRLGGRCWSLRNVFPGQVVERGGEFIDTAHKTMLGYAQRFKLDLEDAGKQPGETVYHFGGQRVPEAAIVDELRAFVERMRRDVQTLSYPVTAVNATPADRALDRLSLAEYLATRGAGPLLQQAIRYSYVGEYGREIEEQSALNFLLFIRINKRSRFEPFGISDERYHVVEGNDAIVQGLAGGLPGQIQTGRRLTRVAKRSDGRIELSFGGSTVVHDAVVLAIPFTLLREVALDASLALPAWKLQAIQQLGYGTNAKLMVGFGGRPWQNSGCNGSTYADLPYLQSTWETNPARASSAMGVLTDYTGGKLGLSLNRASVQSDTANFLGNLNTVLPGTAAAAARRTDGSLLSHLEHWPSNPWMKGSYTSYEPGQFTTICGNEGRPVGNLFFAGEHADSFYNWQGYMEGAAVSGITAALAIVRG